MRIISGKYKGKTIQGFNIDGTRPTMDRVKESIFSIVQNYLKDSIVLDLFAGSGNLGIEALSNGSKLCYFVDNNKIAIETINKNLLKVDGGIVLKYDYIEALKYFKNNNIRFDIILLDPPYKDNLINKSLEKIYEYNLLNENGIIVCEYEQDNIVCNYKLLKEKRYGRKKVDIYINQLQDK